MKHQLLLAIVALALADMAYAQGTAFTYQGRLDSSGAPVTGGYDIRVTVFDDAGGGNQRGLLTNSAVVVNNGLFTTTLDFGFGVFNGGPRWLELAVRSNGTTAAFTTLVPRQAILPAPYAFWSANASQAVTISGTVPSSGLHGVYSNPVSFNNPGNGFAGDGQGLNNVNAAQLGGRSAAQFWQTGGNAGANPTNGAFLGTSDRIPLELRVNGERVLRLEPQTNSPNIIGGYSGNIISNGVEGGFIGGGGSVLFPNKVGGNHAAVLGGRGNVASGRLSTAMGAGTTASGSLSTTMGSESSATNNWSTAMGLRTLAGGEVSMAMGYDTKAMGFASTAMGSSTSATTNDATAMGRLTLAGGSASTAMGYRARALHPGAFVWADQQEVDLNSTGANQFLIRASGGVGINTNNPNGAALAVNGNVIITGTLAGNGAGLTNVNLALNSGGAITWFGNFVTAPSLGVGSGPYSVTSADVNGDGKVDLISANANANTLTVLTNNGSGGFGSASSPGVGISPRSVTSTDVNGDGKPDLISANYNANTLSVLTNNGSGGFVLAASPGVTVNPSSVIAADVNGDGKPDLISADYLGNTLSVLTNNGSGVFAPATFSAVGSNPRSVTAADVNGDGKPDLISANSAVGDNTLTVLTNNGNSGFVLAASPGVGSNPQAVTSADVNGDGKPDLISANPNANNLAVLTNNGVGGFLLAFSQAAGSLPFSLTTADVNGDGKPDLISANLGDHTLTVLTNNRFGGFAIASSPGVGNQPLAVIAVDVNGDGRPDLISANYAANTLSVLLNTGTFTGSFSGNGSGLTSLDAGNLTGAVPSRALTSVPAESLTGTVTDANLSANVALRDGGNTFNGNQTIAGNVGIGLTSPDYRLDVQAAQAVGRFTTTLNANGAVLALRNTTPSPAYLGAINFEDADGTPGQIGYLASGQLAFRAGGTELMNLQAGGLYVNGALVSSSDRNAKENFVAVNAHEVLEKVAALPMQSWSYTNRPGVKHVGPMAQDFRAAFGLGEDDKHIATVDADGVALAAIQGLNDKVEARRRWSEDSLRKLRVENAELRARVDKLEQLMNFKLNERAK
jgi:hypothetical protein